MRTAALQENYVVHLRAALTPEPATISLSYTSKARVPSVGI